MQDLLVYIALGIAIGFLAYKFLFSKKKNNCDPDCNC